MKPLFRKNCEYIYEAERVDYPHVQREIKELGHNYHLFFNKATHRWFVGCYLKETHKPLIIMNFENRDGVVREPNWGMVRGLQAGHYKRWKAIQEENERLAKARIESQRREKDAFSKAVINEAVYATKPKVTVL